MNSAHDVGGMHGFGPVVAEEDEPYFHAAWERSAFAVNLLGIGQGITGTLDSNRHSVERMGNVPYVSTSYYEHWMAGVERRLIENGILDDEELHARREAVRKDFDRYALPPAEGADGLTELARGMVKHGAPTLRTIEREPRFSVGDRVITSRRSPRSHTRLPRYARGRVGTIISYHGAHVLPDTNAHDLGECPEPLYCVCFEAAELWGTAAESPSAVNIDLWESYLEPAAEER